MKKRRVVITGIGTLSACGMGHEPLWEMALAGRSAIRELSDFSKNGSPVRLGGEIPNFRPEDFVKTKKALKVMSRDIQLAVVASTLAIQDSDLQLDQIDRTRIGITLAAGLINNDLDELGIAIRASLDSEGQFQLSRFGRDGIRALYPLWLLKYLPNMPACHIAITHGLKGPSNTLMASSTGGLQAVGEASRVIERDDADLMLAGASDSKINPLGLSRLYLLGILSEENHIPSKAYRPFDRRRNGVVVGEGAGLFLLEERQHALKRGARIYGEILGFHTSRHSQEKSMRRSIEESERDSGEIDFILAHGSGIPEEDISEARSITQLFQSRTKHLPVTATKSVTGHLVDASGTAELSVALLSLTRELLPPIANLEEPDPQCKLHFVSQRPQSIIARTFLLTSFDFGGPSASLVVGRHGK